MGRGLDGLSLFQYWHSEEIPEDVTVLMETFGAHNPELRHRVFDETAAADLIATHLGGREADCFRALAMPAMQADYFRCCALLALGGVYVDADTRCRRPLCELIEGDHSAVMRERQRGPFAGVGNSVAIINNDFLVFKDAGHPALELVLELASGAIERSRGRQDMDKFAIVFLTGPAIYTGLHLAYRLGSLDSLSRFFADTRLEPFGRRLRAVVGDYDRLAEAFGGVRVLTVEEAESFADLELRLPYKATPTHWKNYGPRVFRPSGATERR